MSKVKEVFYEVNQIRIPINGNPVETTVAKEMCEKFSPYAKIKPVEIEDMQSQKRFINTAVYSPDFPLSELPWSFKLPERKDWVLFIIDKNLCIWLLASKTAFLYFAWRFVQENFLLLEIDTFTPWFKELSFAYEKSTFDLFLTQYARMIRNFDKEMYIREYARLGFTHIEVNALAAPFPAEKGVKGEFYPDFYTYCPALDQFVASRLNVGIYPEKDLQENLKLLKENVRIAVKYGLVPGLLCFEPRSVPETFFEKYPTLRGARVDHPFRSFKPRYNLSTVHPVVQQHYTELVTNLMKEVSELGFLSLWTNDSGAGFEHTRSLYVGRNGGAYLIREWKDEKEIACSAAANIINFFQLLRDAGQKINPQFSIITRMEPFYGEYEFVWPQLRDGIDVEVNSLLARGWEANYPHPRYPDIKVSGSAYHNVLWDEEKTKSQELRERGSKSFFYHSFASYTNHEPLLGIPFPWLTYEKLKSLSQLGISTLSHLGGINPPDKVPFSVNQEIFRMFQIDPEMEIDKTVLSIAEKYSGFSYSRSLIKGWHLLEKAIRSFPPLSIYSHYGVVWQRLFVRPLVPDISCIEEKERNYYEKYMCTSSHNPNRIDLGQDVLFELLSREYARKSYVRIDKNVWDPLDAAISQFKQAKEKAINNKNNSAAVVFDDQYTRAVALKSLYETLRNTALWIYAVHSYLNDDSGDKVKLRKLITNMINREVENCKRLLKLWETASIEWMIVSGEEETPFIYGENMGELLLKKIKIMEKYKDCEPYIAQDYMFQIANNPYEKSKKCFDI